MLKESSFTFFTKVFIAFLGFLTIVVTARILGPQGRGIYSFLESMITLAVLFGSFGMAMSNIYFLGKKKYSLEILFWNSILIGVVGGAISIGVVGILKFLSTNLFQQIPSIFIWIASFLFPFSIIAYVLWNLLLGLRKTFKFNFVSIIIKTLFFLVLVSAISFYPSTKTAVFSLTIGTLIWFPTLFLFLRKDIFFGKPKINFFAAGDAVKFGLVTQFWSIAQFLGARSGIFFINFFLNPTAVGIYSVSFLAGELLGYSSNSLATVLLPKISGDNESSDSEAAVNKSCRLNLFFVFLGGTPLFFLAPLIIQLFFGGGFLPGILTFKIFIFGAAVVSISNILSSYFIGRGVPKYLTLASLFSLVSALLGNVILIPKIGINGAAFATVISYSVLTVTLIYFYKKISHNFFHIRDLLIPRVKDFKDLNSSYISLFNDFKLKFWRKKS